MLHLAVLSLFLPPTLPLLEWKVIFSYMTLGQRTLEESNL